MYRARCVWIIQLFFLKETAEVTARFTTLSFNHSVTGGFNLHSRGADSLDSISLQVDTFLDVLSRTHPCARIQQRSVHTLTCSVHKLDVTIRIQAAHWYVFQCMYSRALPTQVCTAKCMYLVNAVNCYGCVNCHACTRVYSQGLSLALYMG